MKKIILIISLAVFSANTASSQVVIALLFGDKLNSDKLQFGLLVGPTLKDITGTTSSLDVGVNLGLFLNVKLNDNFYFHPEAIPKLSLGAKNITPYPVGDVLLDSLFANGSVRRSIKAMGLPLLIRYRVAGRFFVEAGPQVNLTLRVKDVFETDVNENKLSYTTKVTNQFTTLDAGYVLGIAYKFLPSNQSIALDIRYYGGLTDIMKTAPGRQTNSAWTLNVYIPIGSGSNNTNHTKK